MRLNTGDWVVGEVELVEPSLFFSHGGADCFARNLLQRL